MGGVTRRLPSPRLAMRHSLNRQDIGLPFVTFDCMEEYGVSALARIVSRLNLEGRFAYRLRIDARRRSGFLAHLASLRGGPPARTAAPHHGGTARLACSRPPPPGSRFRVMPAKLRHATRRPHVTHLPNLLDTHRTFAQYTEQMCSVHVPLPHCLAGQPCQQGGSLPRAGRTPQNANRWFSLHHVIAARGGIPATSAQGP